MTDNFADKLNAARSRIAASLLPKISSAVAASSASKLTAAPMGNNLKEHIANGGQPTNDMINYFNDKTIADGVNRQNISDAQQNDYFGVSTANLTSSNVFMAAAANAVNLAGGAVGTLAQWGNTLAGDEFTAQAIAMEAGTPAHVLDAYNALNRTRKQKKQLAEQSRVIREQIRNKQGDPIQLNAQLLAIETAYKGIQVDPNVMNTLSVKSGDTTYLEKLDASQELRHKGARVTAGSGEGFMPAMKSSDFSNPYYKKPLEQANKGDQFITDTNALADRQLDEGTLTGTLQGIGNKVLATGKSIGNVLAAGVNHPMGVLQYTAESAPYFALPGIGTIAIGNQTAVEGRSKFETRTGQALPTTGQNAAMLAADAVYMGLNYVGDSAVNSALRGATAGSVRSSKQILLDAARGVGSTGLRAAGKEGLAEGAQTYLEESGQNLGTYFNPDTVGQAAAIGAMSSGVVSTPADLKHGVKNYKINKFLNSPVGQEALAQVEKQKVLDAIPLAELQNPTSASHNPVEAINRMTTGVTEATKDTVIKDVSALVNNLQDVVTERETSLANAEQSVAQATKNIPIIDQLIASGNTDPALVDARKAYTDFLEGDGSPENIKKLQDLVTTSTSELINAHEHAKIKLKAVRDAFGVANPNTATPSVPSINPSTGGTVYPYPSKGAGLRAALEANDSTKNYTPEQRDTLRAFSDAVVLIHSNKDLQKVGIDIKQGGNTGGQKYRGLEQYMERVVEAINNGNVRSQQYFNKGLALFSQSHTSKAETFQKAFDTLTPGMVNIVQKNDDTNTWEIYDTVTEKVFNSGNFKEGLRNTGGYGIHRNSLKFIETVKSEAEGIAQVSDAINLMVNGSQSVAPTPAVPAPVVAPTPPIVIKPSDTTPPVVTPAPEAPVQSGVPATTATPSDTVSIDKLEATVKSFVKVRDITSEEYKQDTATVYEKQWFKVKAAYNNTVRRLVELVSKGVTTVEDVAALTDILNKLYEFAGQTIDLNSDRAALDKLTQRIDSLATALFSDVSPEIIDAYLKGKTESTERRGDKLTTDRDGAKSFDGRTIEYAFNAPHLQETKTTAPVEAEPSIPETVEGLVKEYGYLGELLADEDVDKVFKQGVEKILELKADTMHTKQSSFSSFVDLLAFDGGVEYFTRLAKNDPNISKLTKAANKLHNLMRLAQHITVLNGYHQGDRSINLKEYLDTRPELKSIFEEIRDLKTGHTLVSVIVDLQEAKDVLRSETEKLVTLVGLMYIQAAFEKGQQYLIDTNYADLQEVIFPYTLGLLSHKLIGQLQKHKVVGDDIKGVRELITPTELSFLDKIDGVPVGELSKEDFEMVKALVQNRVNSYFNQYEVLEYPRRPGKVYSQIVHDIIVEHLPKEGFALENFTPEEVIKGAVPQSFIWNSTEQNTPVETKEVPVKQEQPVVESTNKVDPKTFTNHSGGAKGYDAEWDIIGAEFGFINNNHYLLPVDGSVADPRLKAKGVKPVDATKDIGQVAATGAATGEAQIAVTKAERAMGRIEKTHTTRNTKKIRNYAQVKNADGIFAIGSLIPKGADITIAQGNAVRVALVPQVNGGTSVAVQLGIMMDKPTYVFNQVSNDTYAEGWYKWDKSKQDFVPIETPILTKNFAGIGTSSNTTAQGKQAIKDVYTKTLSSLDTRAEPKDKTTFPISEESKTIYGKLGNKTVSGNVVINKVYQLAGVAYAKSIGAIFSLRVDNSNKHFGNPFSSVASEIAKGLVATKSTKESVQRYIDWVLAETTVYNPEQHAWIREQLKSGNLKGKQIVYYKELGEPSHATALDYLINKYDWGTKPAATTIPVTPKESTEVVVVPETVVPVTPPDSETGDVEIQEDVSTLPEVAEPKEKTTPAGGLSILAGTGSVKDRMKAEQEKAADQILRAGSTIVIDRSKVDKEDGRAWLAKVATTTKEIITTGIQRANLVVASFYQKAKAPSKLVQVKDFAKTVLAMSPAEQAQMLSDVLGETATDEQVQFLESFLMFDKSLRGTMDLMAVPSGKNTFRFNDYLQYLYTDIKSETKTVKILNKKTKTLEDVDQVITTGTLDENVKTAISLGIHTFLIEKTGQFTLDHEGVAELLGIKNTKSVPPEIHRMFRSIGNTQPNVVKYLGTKAYQALQLSMDPNVPTQRKESLINALGSLAVQTMLKEGLLQYTRISNDTILNAKAAIKGETNTVNPSKSFTLYLRPTYDTKKTRGKDGWVYETEPKPIPKIEAIKLSAKGNTKVMTALFSVDGRDILPMLKKPTKFTQNTLSKTGNEVPDATADLVLQMMQKAYNVNGYTYSAMKTLFETDPDALYAMVGVVSDEDVAKQHISIRGATESKNEALKRSVTNGLDFIDSLTPDEDGNFPDYYLPMSVWSVNRVGVTSNLFNEQGDKVHRALTIMTAHKQQVTISPVVDSDNKLTQYGRFLTGVAAYMEGIKINGKTVDKTDGVSFLPGFERFIETPLMQAAIKAVGSMVMGSATDTEIQLVKDMVISLEGGAMSLTSLIALYEASQAVDGVFTTSMSTGSDGVTNGMALSLLMYDAASLSEDFVSAMSWKERNAFNKASPKAKEAILQAKKDAFDLANPKDTKGMTKAEKDAFNAGGIFFEGDSVDSMVKFRKSGKADLYQQLAKVQKDLLQKYVQDNKQNTVLLNFIAAMNNIDPTFGTRAGAKVSLVPFVYGSGFRSIGAAQSRAFMEEFYKALTKAKLSKDADKIRQFQANYVALAQAVGTPREEIVDFVKLTVKEALDTELTLKQIKAITGLENKIRSQITEEALTQVAGTLIQSRKRVSGLANVGFESYNRLYRALYDQAYAKLAEGKFLPYRIGTSGSLIGEKIVVEGMSVSQNQKVNDELKDFTPQIYSVGGVFSTNGEKSAHSMWSEDQIQDPTDSGTTNPTFGATTEGKALPTPNSDGAVFPSKSITTNLHIRSVKSRGAATNAAIVQAMDAWITAKVSAAMDTFNHHDENVSSIDKAAEMGQLQNKTLFNAVLDYDVYLEVLNGSLLRPLRGIIKLSKRDDTLAIAKEEVGKVMADLRQYMYTNFGGFNEDMGMLASLVHEMYSLEIAKLTKYKNLKSISQYGIEGGEYTVTEKDVARIDDLIASHVASRTALLKEVAKMSADLKAIGAKPKAEPVVTAPEPEKQTSKAEPKKEVSVPVVYSKDGEGSFQGFVGGFSDSGKGTITGDGKDVAMRKEATSFIGEVSNIKGSSSTHTSATEIAAKTQDDVEYAQEQSHTPSTSPTIYTINYTPKGGNVTMLARNGSLKGKPLDEVTKEIIYEAMLAGESFIVGDMPGVDSQFVEFLNEIGANFKIYHTGKAARIQGKFINPNQLDMFAEPETKEETSKGKPASVDSFIVRNEEGVVNTLATLNSMPINDSTLVGKVIKQVVEALKGKLPANLKVHMITGSNLPTALDKENVKDTLSRGSAGVTYSVGNTHTIGLVEGMASMITFIHELIHASTVSGLSGTSAEARKLKFNISKLRGEALSAYRKYTASLAPVSKIEAERRDKVYMDAFNSEGDKDAEFVAMAMSEPAIIAFLATVPAPKTTNTGTLMSVFSAFIKSVGEFLGVVKNAQGKDVESVLEAMVRQTAHLMNINDQSSASEQINNYPGQQAAVDAVRLIREYPSKEIFNVLPASLDVGFDTYLSSLMDTIVDKTFNHLSFPSTTYTPLEVWENAITDGRTPYTTRAVAAGFILSERELFAIETLEVALKGAMDAGITTPVYKEMERAYESARKTLKPESFYNGDWSTALESDREIARNKYKHLFKMEGGQATRSDYMSRFMAMALASSEVNSLLGFPTLTEPRVDGTISSKILAYYEYAMDWVSGHLTGTMRYQTINSKLPTLAQKLVDIDHKKRDQALSSVYDSVSDNLNKADKYLKESGNTLADKLENMIGDSKKGLPSAARTASRVVLRGAAMDMLKVSKTWRDMSAPNTVLGWKGELLNELSNPSSVGQAVRSLLRIHTRLQTERKTHKSTTKESILSNFLNGGKNLSKDDHSAITYGVLRGDLKALYDLHGIRGIEKLLNNADEVESEVARLEGLITNETHIVRAKDLAHYMTSGEVNLMLAKNALSIARDVGLPTVLEEGMVSEEAVSNIDMLVSLYAIQYMKSGHLQTLQKLFKQEGARTDGNGLAALMKYHQAIEQEAKDTLFEGNSVSIIKGYTPEITNPHREIKIVTLATDAKHLEAMGYQLHSILSADPNDVNQAKRMVYFTEEPSTQRFVTGAMSLTADSSKGTSIIDGSSLSVKDKISALKSITTRSATKLKAKSAKDYDPTNIKNRGIAPTYSNLGSIQDFRYEMTHATRDGLLQRNNNFAEIMGTYAGSNFDKASTPKHNETVIDALYKDYKENYLKDPRAYVQIGKDSTDPRAVEMYAMLPYKTRKYIDKVWGKREPMWVRNDALLATFGTNKYSIGEAFEKNPDTRNIVEKTIVDMFRVLFGDTAKLRALQGERLNQELVSWFKSTIVIRNLTTLMGNQSANVGVLLTMGVSPVDIIKDSLTAFKAGNRFRKDNTELVRVENNMKANVGNFEDNVQLQARLKDSIARNPLKQFLDAGMLNTIVEDVSLDVEDYNYKSKLAQQLDDQLDKLNPTVRKIGANLVAAPSTELYQVLANATQLSDFTAKYTLYKHLTSKAKDKLSHEDALAMADRMFINYDVPTSKELQYANDMGFLMFTKYTLRIQRAIAYLLKERKASLLAQGMLGTALGMPLATAPAFFLNVGLPFHAGALMVPGALTQPLPIKLLSGGF